MEGGSLMALYVEMIKELFCKKFLRNAKKWEAEICWSQHSW